MEFTLSEEQQLLLEGVRKLMADARMQAAIKKANETKEFSFESMRLSAEKNYLGMCVSAKYGGLEVDSLAEILAIEEMARESAAVALNVLVQNSLVMYPLEIFGSEAQKEKYLPGLISGDFIGCFANTEPNAGSDAKSIALSAVRKGNKFILNGEKCFSTNASGSGVAIVMARTAKRRSGSPGTTAFCLDIGRDAPGFELTRVENKFGQFGSTLCQFALTDYEASDENVLGKVNGGWTVCGKTFEHSRSRIAAQGCGLARHAFDVALAYAKSRTAFGGSIFSQSRPEFADLRTEIEAARLLTYKAACLETAGDPAYQMFASMAKLTAAEVAKKAALFCIQKGGGKSFVVEEIAMHLFHDAVMIPVYEGASEVQRLIIAKNMEDRHGW